jgi:hypothetical protein
MVKTFLNFFFFWWKYNYYKFLILIKFLKKNKFFSTHKIIIKMNYIKIYIDNFILTKLITTKFNFISNRFFFIN